MAVADQLRYLVQTKEKWQDGSWTTVPGLAIQPGTSLDRVLPPGIGTATFDYHYGPAVTLPDTLTAQVLYPLQIQHRFIRVVAYKNNDTATAKPIWYGIVVSEHIRNEAHREIVGYQIIQANSLERVLVDAVIDKTVFGYQSDGSPRPWADTEVFNRPAGVGLIDGNREPGTTHFAGRSTVDSPAVRWTWRQIVEHYLDPDNEFMRKNGEGEP